VSRTWLHKDCWTSPTGRSILGGQRPSFVHHIGVAKSASAAHERSLRCAWQIVRGVRFDERGVYASVLQTDLIYLGIIVAVNLLALYLALSFFILPLEK
jgi:hypothetical protein